jgi:hypothetical protein
MAMRALKKWALLFVAISLLFLAACDGNAGEAERFEVNFFRKVARESFDTGWVYTFVYEDYKDETADDSDIIKYNFYGINLRYKYNDAYIQKTVRKSESGAIFTETVIPPFLALGDGSDAEKRDMALIETMLDYKTKSVADLLALHPDDYTFEAIDKAAFFRLMNAALTGEAQKEGTDPAYWDKPSYAFFAEPAYFGGYKFQIAFLQETGCVDELHIDVLYQTGEAYNAYVQLSDLVENNTATEEQKQAFHMIAEIENGIKENENFMYAADMYKDEKGGVLDFSRLYVFLKNIHENAFELYLEDPHVERVEEMEGANP